MFTNIIFFGAIFFPVVFIRPGFLPGLVVVEPFGQLSHHTVVIVVPELMSTMCGFFTVPNLRLAHHVPLLGVHQVREAVMPPTILLIGAVNRFPLIAAVEIVLQVAICWCRWVKLSAICLELIVFTNIVFPVSGSPGARIFSMS
jgi:hypothetical protein